VPGAAGAAPAGTAYTAMGPGMHSLSTLWLGPNYCTAQ
jgi:hypothetical protein